MNKYIIFFFIIVFYIVINTVSIEQFKFYLNTIRNHSSNGTGPDTYRYRFIPVYRLEFINYIIIIYLQFNTTMHLIHDIIIIHNPQKLSTQWSKANGDFKDRLHIIQDTIIIHALLLKIRLNKGPRNFTYN